MSSTRARKEGGEERGDGTDAFVVRLMVDRIVGNVEQWVTEPEFVAVSHACRFLLRLEEEEESSETRLTLFPFASFRVRQLKASRSLAWQTDEDEENVSVKKEDGTSTPLKNDIDGESEAGFDSMTVRSHLHPSSAPSFDSPLTSLPSFRRFSAQTRSSTRSLPRHRSFHNSTSTFLFLHFPSQQLLFVLQQLSSPSLFLSRRISGFRNWIRTKHSWRTTEVGWIGIERTRIVGWCCSEGCR